MPTHTASERMKNLNRKRRIDEARANRLKGDADRSGGARRRIDLMRRRKLIADAVRTRRALRR